jgi:POT family proton-dependent oligopeptide transporter
VAAGLYRFEQHRIAAILFLLALQPLFWGLFEQAGGSLNLYTDRYVDRAGVPASLFQSINPFYIMLLGPLFSWGWTALGRRGLEPSAPAKFGLALMLVGAGFLALVWGAGPPGAATPVLYIFVIYLLHTAGELCLSPVGLSAMNRLAPAHMGGLIMGAWFFGSAGGNLVAGRIGAATGDGGAGAAGKERMLDIYHQIGWVAVALGVVVLLVAPLIGRLMHLDRPGDAERLPAG